MPEECKHENQATYVHTSEDGEITVRYYCEDCGAE